MYSQRLCQTKYHVPRMKSSRQLDEIRRWTEIGVDGINVLRPIAMVCRTIGRVLRKVLHHWGYPYL